MVRLKVIYRRFLTLIAWSTYRDVLDIEIMSRIASLCEWGASSLHIVPFSNSSGFSPKLVTSILLTRKMDLCEWSALSKNTRNWCLWTITLKPLKPFGEESTALTPRLFYLLSILSLSLFQRFSGWERELQPLEHLRRGILWSFDTVWPFTFHTSLILTMNTLKMMYWLKNCSECCIPLFYRLCGLQRSQICEGEGSWVWKTLYF